MTFLFFISSFALPMTMSGNRFYELIAKALNVTSRLRDESRSKFKLALFEESRQQQSRCRQTQASSTPAPLAAIVLQCL